MAKKGGSRKLTYAGQQPNRGLNPWIGWGLSTLLLLLFNRSNDSDTEVEQDPNKYEDDNLSMIGSPIPAIIGRVMMKNPLISYYGAWKADIYTEEYGMHTALDWIGILMNLLFALLADLTRPVMHVAKNMSMYVTDPSVTTSGGSGSLNNPEVNGLVYDTDNGAKFGNLLNALMATFLSLIIQLFTNHMGKTTIQKGFLYYMGWQHILCWTGENLGIKSLWMNVFDGELEASTEQAVWDNGIAWKKDNLYGMSFKIDNENMFGGVDEQGGFVGQLRFYFGDDNQPKDSFMVSQMANASTIPPNLKGLTPKYPMFFTCVISNEDKQTGAYIGRQCTLPMMWFEIVNYPDRLAKSTTQYRITHFIDRCRRYLDKLTDFVNSKSVAVQATFATEWGLLTNEFSQFEADRNSNHIPNLIQYIDDLYNAWPPNDQLSLLDYIDDWKKLLNHGIWTLGRLNDDANPAEAIYEILKNELWGCQYTDDRIDIESLVDLGCTCEEENLGISMCLDNIQAANEYINRILQHINGVKFDDPTTGKMTYKLIRDDFYEEDLKVFDITNVSRCEFSRLDWSETKSACSVSFLDASAKYAETSYMQYDIANRYITKYFVEQTIDGSYFTTTSCAKWLAEITLLGAGYPLSSVNLTANRYGFNLKIGDPFILTWSPYGLEKIIYRVTDIDYSNISNGAISITGVEDIFSFQRLHYANVDDIGWDIPIVEPDEVRDFVFLEMPYEYTVSLDTYLYCYAAQPNQDTIRWNIWRQVSGTYNNVNASTVWSMMGLMTYGLAMEFDDSMNGFEIAPCGHNSDNQLLKRVQQIAAYPNIYNNKSKLNLIAIDDELIAYNDIITLANGHYQVRGIVRGVLDTIPGVHMAQSKVVFLDYGLNIQANNLALVPAGTVSNESVEITGDTSSMLGTFDINKTVDFSTTRRAEAPSIMGNLKMDADRDQYCEYHYLHNQSNVISGDIEFIFNTRNKFFSQQIIKHSDASITTIPSTTQYKVRLSFGSYVDREFVFNALDSNNAPIENFIISWEEYCNAMGTYLSYYQTVKFDVWAYDTSKNLDSYAMYTGQRTVYIPQLVAICDTKQDAETFATNTVNYFSQDVIVPASSVAPSLAISFYQCPVIFLGTQDPSGIFNQDGIRYNLGTTAYRINGCNINNVPSLTEFTVDDGYVIRSNFTQSINNYEFYRKYNSTTGEWDVFVPW